MCAVRMRTGLTTTTFEEYMATSDPWQTGELVFPVKRL